MSALVEGTRVYCTCPSIDRRIGDGEAGVVVGFARFSSYHGREVLVRLDNGGSDYFWLRDVVGGAA